ncbi:phosphatidylserine/phosphatidylglycerophosphate/cardiolipin synthase family protein [Mesorhizobium sp. ZMM04-5]|uniref:Phospholipase D n=1 Tax=Mesorhizobium marinum TaxID=3228790 RepID=A0ABV3QXY4_9HYPH
MSAAIRSAAPLLAALLGVSACAAPLAFIDTACERVADENRCSVPSLETALLPGAEPDDADYNRQFLALLAEQKLGEADRANGTGPFGRDVHSITNRDFLAAYRGLEQAADTSRLLPSRRSRSGTFSAAWRLSRQTLFLDADTLDGGRGEFQFSGLQARSVEIVVTQISGGPVSISGHCDGPIAIGPGRRIVEAGRPVHLSLSGSETLGASTTLFPATSLNRCDLSVRSQGRSRSIALVREETSDPRLARLDSLYQRCPAPDPNGLSPLERVFFASRDLSETCPMPIGRPKLLLDERDAFNAKVEALAGTTLSDAFFDAGNPEAPIDMSRAPRLKLIYFSFLDFKADFSGRVMERLIRYHAARGAKVRMMVTDVLERDKDRALLRRLAADHPNVQLQEYTWEPAAGAPLGEQASQFYKTHHAKMLATLARDPRRSRAIVGGRNIHDGFLYHEPLDLSRYPDLHQYGATNGLSLNYYSNWSDFEIEVDKPEAVRILVAHLGTLWHRDAETNQTRPFSIAGKPTGHVKRSAVARHFISVPYADGRALEDYYIDLMDSAEHTIEIVNPYLNLPPKVADALTRAIDRGVKITLVTRIDLKGDFGGQFITELNELFVEKYARDIEMYEYLGDSVVLHSKILMIDGRYVSVSSVNLNHRSFIQDSENGIAALDPAFYDRMKPVFEYYIARSKPVAPDVRVPLFYRLVFASQIVREAF